MSGGLDLSLDDIIGASKPKREGRGRAAGRGAGRSRGVLVKPTIAKPRQVRGGGVSARAVDMAIDDVWEHDKFPGRRAGTLNVMTKTAGAAAGGAKLLVSNLHQNVTTHDVKELFAMVGPLKIASVNFDQSGRSKGTAEVVFERREDAATAQKRYNGATLDGLPMAIEAVAGAALQPGASLLSSGKVLAMPGRGGGAAGAPRAPPPRTVTFNGGGAGGRGGSLGGRGGLFARATGIVRGGGSGGGRGRGGAGGRGGGGRGGGVRGPPAAPTCVAHPPQREKTAKSAEQLDAELDSYHAPAAGDMQE